jgi:ubiquinone/menaquinone biosynthesis C-methylase UbiE
MLAPAQRARATTTLPGADFLGADAERLPFADGVFDVVVSNGALNLVPDKDAAFREIARVLRPGGALAVADLLVRDDVPESVLADMDAWSS